MYAKMIFWSAKTRLNAIKISNVKSYSARLAQLIVQCVRPVTRNSGLIRPTTSVSMFRAVQMTACGAQWGPTLVMNANLASSLSTTSVSIQFVPRTGCLIKIRTGVKTPSARLKLAVTVEPLASLAAISASLTISLRAGSKDVHSTRVAESKGAPIVKQTT